MEYTKICLNKPYIEIRILIDKVKLQFLKHLYHICGYKFPISGSLNLSIYFPCGNCHRIKSCPDWR